MCHALSWALRTKKCIRPHIGLEELHVPWKRQTIKQMIDHEAPGFRFLSHGNSSIALWIPGLFHLEERLWLRLKL